MENVGLRGLVINSDTIQEARLRKEDLWKQAETGPNILFMAPEQLQGMAGPAADQFALARTLATVLAGWGAGWSEAAGLGGLAQCG